MKNVPKIDLGLTGYDELFMNDTERMETKLPHIYDIPLELIDDFPDHPFKVRDDEDIQAINLVPQDTPRQVDLFMNIEKIEKAERLDQCIETIRQRFGKNSIRNGILFQNLRMPSEKPEIAMPTGVLC